MKKIFTLFLLLVLMTGCVKDNLSEHNESALEHINNPKKDLSVAYFDMDALNEELLLIEPVVAEFKVLSKKISNSKSLKITAESSAGLSSQKSAFKNALVVSKKDKPMSYSISFENQSIEKFANVVVQKDTLGVLKTNVIEYEPTKESVRLYNTGRIGIDQLQGTMRIYESIADYLEQTSAQGIHIKKTALRFSNPCNNVFDFNFGTGQMRGGGGSKVCSVAKTVIPCRAGGRGEHGPSLCGVGTGSTTVITYQCTRIYTSSISSTLSSMINAVLPLGPCGGGNPSLRNVGINAPFVPLTPCPDQLTCAKADALIDALSALGVTLPRTLKRRVYEGGAFFDFAEAAVVAKENGGVVDFDDRLIYNPALDQDYRRRMAKKEKEIFDGLTNYQKTQYLMSAQQAWKYAEIYHSESLYNGNGDAVRHAFWNALATVRLGEALTEKLTDAHESDPLEVDYTNHFKEREMDMFNNKVGRDIANKSGKLYLIVEEALKNGELRKLSNLADNRRATDSSQLISTN